MPIVQMTDSTKPIIDVIIPAVAIALLYCFALFDILEAMLTAAGALLAGAASLATLARP